MSIRGDFHTHTAFCDGTASPREMAEAAWSAGLAALGFSGHSYDAWCGFGMDAQAESRYRAEVASLAREYAGRLLILCGIEKDVYGAWDTSPYDYVIASGHYVPLPGGGFSAADLSPEVTEAAIREHFSGDPYRYAAAYYDGLAERLVQEPRADIVGHFDLITKFNEGGRFFDEAASRYRQAALAALDAAAEKCPRFEINTGAVSRGWRTAPYPAPFLLRRMKELGCRIILSSDSHSAATLCAGFYAAAELARSCGFTEADVLTECGFRGTKLQ